MTYVLSSLEFVWGPALEQGGTKTEGVTITAKPKEWAHTSAYVVVPIN
jgi:hypothetical protein